MDMLFIVLLVAAAVCFLVAAVFATFNKANLVALGLFFAVLVPLIQLLTKTST